MATVAWGRAPAFIVTRGKAFGKRFDTGACEVRLDLHECDALVLSACVQIRSLAAIEDVERHSGLPPSPPLRPHHGPSCARSTSNQRRRALANFSVLRPTRRLTD